MKPGDTVYIAAMMFEGGRLKRLRVLEGRLLAAQGQSEVEVEMLALRSA